MGWFSRVRKFKLYVHHPTLKNYLYQEHDTSDNPADLCIGWYPRRGAPQTVGEIKKDEQDYPEFINACLRYKYLSGDWAELQQFVVRELHSADIYPIYRGVSNYNWFSLRRLITHGNDRYTDDGRDKAFQYTIGTYEPHQVIWGSNSGGKAWEYAIHPRHHPPKQALLLVYDSSKLKSVPNTHGYGWQLKEDTRDFKEALIGVIRVFFD